MSKTVSEELEPWELVEWLTQYAHDLAVPIYARDVMEQASRALSTSRDGELREALAECRAFVARRGDADTDWGAAATTCDLLAKIDAALSRLSSEEPQHDR